MNAGKCVLAFDPAAAARSCRTLKTAAGANRRVGNGRKAGAGVVEQHQQQETEAGPWRTLQGVRERRPLVHVITSFVAADLTANLLLSAGARVVMAQDKAEAEDFVALADALCLNLGILTADRVEPMIAAARFAVELGRPWVLDPVGIGISAERRSLAMRLSGLQPTVIRGNAAEILAMAEGEEAPIAGVDSSVDSAEALDAAHDLSRSTGALVAVSGPVDYVTDGSRLAAVANGHHLMARVTGVGCALSALMAACCTVEEDVLAAASHALAILGLAGELAADEASGPASFRTGLIDRLYSLDQDSLDAGARIQ
jgi:hydroxyethylthiazole kinase